MNDKLLTVDQVSEYLGVHRDTVYAMIRSRRLPALQLGGRKASWRISESDLLQFVANRKAAGGSDHNSVGSLELARAEERAAFEREQRRERDAFDGRQRQQLADFEAGQGRRNSAGQAIRDGDGSGANGRRR